MSIKLSRRLQAICDMVSPGSSICDVGCDHALVDIYLLQEGKIKKALAMDVADGPLSIARQNLELTGLSGCCEVRKSDGLKEFHPGEDYDTLIIAGMGGILMRRILEDAAADDIATIDDMTKSFHHLILSPQSEPWLVRAYMMQNQIGITNEQLVEEDGKFYLILYGVPGTATVKPDWEALASRTAALSEEEANTAHIDSQRVAVILRDPQFQQQAEQDYGPVLLARQDPTLRTYISGKIRSDLAICKTLAHNKDSANAHSRLAEVLAELGMLQVLLYVLSCQNDQTSS